MRGTLGKISHKQKPNCNKDGKDGFNNTPSNAAMRSLTHPNHERLQNM